MGELPSCSRERLTERNRNYTNFYTQGTTVHVLTMLFLFGYSRQRLNDPFQPTFCLTSMLLTVVRTISGVAATVGSATAGIRASRLTEG